MNDTRKIKGLQSHLKTLEAEASVLRDQMKTKQKEYDLKMAAIKGVKKEIEKIGTGLRVSEHAILRYLERVKGIDIEEIEKEILSDSVRGLVETLGGNGTLPNGEYSVVMRDYVVTTITT